MFKSCVWDRLISHIISDVINSCGHTALETKETKREKINHDEMFNNGYLHFD